MARNLEKLFEVSVPLTRLQVGDIFHFAFNNGEIACYCTHRVRKRNEVSIYYYTSKTCSTHKSWNLRVGQPHKRLQRTSLLEQANARARIIGKSFRTKRPEQ